MSTRFIAPQRYFAPPYSQLASAYDATLGIANFIATRAAFERLVERYDIVFHSAADVGCGSGLFACYLNQCWNVPVFGVDRSPEMLAVARCNCTRPECFFLAARYPLPQAALLG
jgi:ubiquinone/menaquinone biosynthesis C-methylase UbiE